MIRLTASAEPAAPDQSAHRASSSASPDASAFAHRRDHIAFIHPLTHFGIKHEEGLTTPVSTPRYFL